MEYGLRDKIACLSQKQIKGLNPCFDGIWSASITRSNIRALLEGVLILVLMEYGLRESQEYETNETRVYCLNPCFNGIWSASRKDDGYNDSLFEGS